MSSNIEISTDTKTRKHSAEAVNRAMARFPLIVEILAELSKAQIPFPGDDDLHHGSHRTLTTILAELAKIDPAPPGKSSKAEEIVHNWLKGDEVVRLIDADKLQRIQQFIERIFVTRPN